MLLLEPGVSFHQLLGWQLELLLGPGISACHHPDLWLDPWASPPCAAAQLYLCSPVVCIKILENKLTCRIGICLDKTFFFFLKQNLTTLTSASGSASVLSEGPFLLRRTKIM